MRLPDAACRVIWIPSPPLLTMTLPVPATAGETRWYFVRVHGGDDGKSVAYLAPIWITAK